MEIKEIGVIGREQGLFSVKLHRAYREGLTGIEGYSHVKIIWWADKSEGMDERGGVVIDRPYAKGPEKVGVFATRSPIRPNPVCETIVRVASVDPEEGIIRTYYVDAFPGTAVIDIKPYLPCTDASREVGVPAWCRHWPSSMEESGDFNWEDEFNFA